jgi:phosphatidylinositol glycan class B
MNQRRNASSKSQPTKPLITKNPDISKQKGYKSQKSNFFSSEKNIFTLCLAFRIANSLLIRTYFNPDEHWQALEVAHRIVFG